MVRQSIGGAFAMHVARALHSDIPSNLWSRRARGAAPADADVRTPA